MTTGTLDAIPATVKRGRGRPKGSLNKKTLERLAAQETMPNILTPKTLREDKFHLSGSLRPDQEKYSTDQHAVKAFSKIGHRYMNEAAQVLKDHAHMNPAWKRNISAFLQRCLYQVPYVANWHWAIHALKTFKKVYAPFRYFKMCLFYPTKFKLAGTDPTAQEKARYVWLKRTKGAVAARSWAAKHAGEWYNTAKLVRNREKSRRTNRQNMEVKVARAQLLVEERALSPIEIYERQRAELKAAEYAKGWRDDQ